MDGTPDITDRTITIERSFRASPAEVYAAWTDPDALPRWFGPDGFACTTHAIDVRVGGEWRFDMTGHGRTWPNRHRWTALVPARRIEFLLDDGSEGAEPFAVVVTLAPEGTGTRVTHTYDWTDLHDEQRIPRAKRTQPANLLASIDRLAGVVGG